LHDWTSAKTGGKQACDRCHSAAFSRVFIGWKTTSESKIKRYKSYMESLQPSLKKITDPALKSKGKEMADEISYNLNLIEKGHIVHNIEFGAVLFTKTLKDIKELAKLTQNEELLELNAKEDFALKSNCMPCHYGIEELTVEFKDYSVEGKNIFPHKLHVRGEEGLACSTCHQENVSFREKNHGKLIAPGTQLCSECH